MSLPVLEAPLLRELELMRAVNKTLEKDDCLSWHQFCNAECCRQWSLKDEGQDLSQQKIRIFGLFLPDIIRYYELHGAKYRKPWLYIPTKNAKRHNGRIFILNRCKALTKDNRCSLHGQPSKPKVCQELNYDNVVAGKFYGGAKITPRCKYQFVKEDSL